MSEAHLRQMSLFRDNAASYVEEFSQTFCNAFMSIMRRKGGLRVRANTVYNELISERHHTHMNSTKWTTLTDFVAYLGKQALCAVDYNSDDSAWYVQYIDRDPLKMARKLELEQQAAKEERLEMQAEKRIQMQLRQMQEQQQQHVQREDDEKEQQSIVPLDARSEAERLAFSFSSKQQSTQSAPPSGQASASMAVSPSSIAQSATASSTTASIAAAPPISVFRAAGKRSVAAATTTQPSALPVVASAAFASRKRKPMSAVEQLAQENELAKQRKLQLQQAIERVSHNNSNSTKSESIKDEPSVKVEHNSTEHPTNSSADAASSRNWLLPNCCIKCVSKSSSLARVYKRKGRVVKVSGSYATVEFELPESTVESVELHYKDCETVLPAAGRPVVVVALKHPRRGQVANLVAVNESKFKAQVRFNNDQDTQSFDYEDICKLYTESDS